MIKNKFLFTVVCGLLFSAIVYADSNDNNGSVSFVSANTNTQPNQQEEKQIATTSINKQENGEEIPTNSPQPQEPQQNLNMFPQQQQAGNDPSQITQQQYYNKTHNYNFDNNGQTTTPKQVNIPPIDDSIPQEVLVNMTSKEKIEQAKKNLSVFTPEEIKEIKEYSYKVKAANQFNPIKAVPKISTTKVDLSPGSVMPIVRLLPGETSTIVFLDSQNKPFPLLAPPRMSNISGFSCEWLKPTSSVVCSALSYNQSANLTVFLENLTTPVILKLSTLEDENRLHKTRIVDYRLDVHVPARSSNSPVVYARKKSVDEGIAKLDDKIMQSFLNSTPPKGARRIKSSLDASLSFRVWSYDGFIFVRSNMPILNSYTNIIGASDGTKVYKLKPTPLLSVSTDEGTVNITLDVDVQPTQF